MATRRTFGNTWWGQAWLDALEGRAVHDPNRLPRGRTYARQARASDLAIEPGWVRAQVQGSRPEPYDVVLQIRVFRDDEWDCVLDTIAAKAAHAAALLDGELDPDIVADAQAVEVDLLPRSGELRTACSCPDWAEPCKHAAAVCYLIAEALDDDPFVIFHLRGLDRTGLVAAIRARRSVAGTSESDQVAAIQGVVARHAWRVEPAPLPEVPPPHRDGPGHRAPWPSPPPAGAPFTEHGLRLLADDAARRAWVLRLGVGEVTSALELDADADLARHAAWASPVEHSRLAVRSGKTEAALQSWATAWRAAGPAGLRVLDEPSWTPPIAEMAAARGQLEASGVTHRDIQVRLNRITIEGDQQFRRSRDGNWYLFVKHSGRWAMASAGSTSIDDLLDAVPGADSDPGTD